MKRIFSVVLSLLMLLTLFSAVSVSAFADEEAENVEIEEATPLTIVVTGGVGEAIGTDSLNYASAAALKGSYDADSVLLVDVGGFVTSAAAIMSAAGYDLAVPSEIISGWDVTCIAMNSEALSSGAMFEKAGYRVAFIGVTPQGDESSDTYIAGIQDTVNLAMKNGVDYIVLLGDMDAKTIANAVSGADLLLTYGSAASPAVDGDAEGTQSPVIGTVKSGFGTIGIVTIGEDGISFDNIDEAAYDELDLSESDTILALEEAWTPETDGAEEEITPEEADETEETDSEEEIDPEDEAAPEEEDTPEEEAAPEDDTAPEEDTAPDKETETDEESAPEEETTPEDADGAEETTPEDTTGGEETTPEDTTGDEETTPEDTTGGEETTPADTTGGEETTPEDTTGGEDTTSEDTTPAEEITVDTTIYWTKGNTDLEITLTNPIASIKVNGGVLGTEYYDLSTDQKTVSVHANVLNGWGKGNYNFEFSFTDGTAAQIKTVNIKGEAPALASPTPTTVPTDTPAPGSESGAAQTSAAAATSAAKKSSNPATGDNSPIALYVILLVILVAALAVVIILVVRKNKRNAAPAAEIENEPEVETESVDQIDAGGEDQE